MAIYPSRACNLWCSRLSTRRTSFEKWLQKSFSCFEALLSSLQAASFITILTIHWCTGDSVKSCRDCGQRHLAFLEWQHLIDLKVTSLNQHASGCSPYRSCCLSLRPDTWDNLSLTEPRENARGHGQRATLCDRHSNTMLIDVLWK